MDAPPAPGQVVQGQHYAPKAGPPKTGCDWLASRRNPVKLGVACCLASAPCLGKQQPGGCRYQTAAVVGVCRCERVPWRLAGSNVLLAGGARLITPVLQRIGARLCVMVGGLLLLLWAHTCCWQDL
jgi:hypothetical protein